MKYYPIMLAAFIILAIGVGSLFGQDAAPPDQADTTAAPLISEVKDHVDYVIVDKALYEQIQQIEAKQDLALETLDQIKAKLDLGHDLNPAPTTVNLNTASYDELLAVPGIGPVKAGSLIAERGQNGVFADWPDLMYRVSGIGPATLADIQAGGAILE